MPVKEIACRSQKSDLKPALSARAAVKRYRTADGFYTPLAAWAKCVSGLRRIVVSL